MPGRVLFAPLLVALAASADARVCLVSQGQPRAVVVTAEAATETAAYAAEELVRHVQQATGVGLDVVKESRLPTGMTTRVFIGETKAATENGVDPTRLGREAYILHSVGDDLFIVGREDDGDPLSRDNSNVGTLWGVYDFLENELGVRWLWPGRLGTYVPKTETIQLASIDRTGAPALDFRELAWSRTRRFIDGSAKLDPRDARLGFDHEVLQDYAEALRGFLRRHRMGGMDAKPPTGHRFHGWWRRYGREHPDWFALRKDGTRGHPDPDALGVPMCVTNEALQDFIVEQWDGESVIMLGPAADEVERYWDYWEDYANGNMMRLLKLFRDVGFRYRAYPLCAHKAFPIPCFEPARARLAEAMKAARQSPSPEYAERVRFLEIGLEHARLTVQLAAAFDGHREVPEPRVTDARHAADRYLVHGLDTDREAVEKTRDHVDCLGLYARVLAEAYDGVNLPYGDNIVNLVVVEEASGVTAEEIERVLVPNGVALVKSGSTLLESSGLTMGEDVAGWTRYVKPWPGKTDQWTHFLYDASGNAVSKDERVRRPRHLQWYAGPKRSRHHDALASLSAMTSSNGRVFYIFDEGAISIVHRPHHWKLIARDGFNGKLLWKRDIPEWMTHLYNFRAGPKQLPRRLVSVGEAVYVTLGLCAPVEKLDAATRETLLTYEDSGGTEELVYHGGMLLAVVGDPSLLIDKADGCHGYWELAEYEEPTAEKPIVAYDAETGTKRWTVTGENLRHTVPLSLCARGDNVFFLDNRRLRCLDAASGKERWASPFETEGLFIRSYAPTVVASDDVIMCLERNCLRGYSVETGEQLWENKGSIGFGSPGDLFVIGDKVWTAPMRKSIWRESRRNADGIVTTGIDIPKSVFLNNAETAVGLDVHTGEITDELPFAHTQHHHRCYRNKATQKYILLGHSGIQVVNPETKTNETRRWVRGLCQYGIMPANGYLYVPPDTCQCYASGKINGFFALSERNSWEDVEIAPVLEKGPAYAGASGGPGAKAPDDGAWPTYRGDVARSGSSPCEVPVKPAVTWEADIGETVTAPVIAEGRVFVADRDAYTVHCLDAADGKEQWKYLANGPVDSPPTIYRVHGSVLVLDDTVYFAAGYSSNLDGGIRLYGLDVWTGQRRCAAGLASGHWGDDGTWGFLADILGSDGKTINMRGVHFDKELRKTRGGGPLVATTGLLEDTWFHRMGWHGMGGKGQLIVFGEGSSFSVVNPYTGLRHRRKGRFKEFNQVGHLHQKFTRYREEFFPVGTTITCKKKGDGRGWSKDVDFQPRAMLLAGDKLCLAGWTDAVVIELKTGRPKDPADPDPHDAYLRIHPAYSGELLAQTKLEAEPVFDGMAAAGDRLFLSLNSGKLVCLGQ